MIGQYLPQTNKNATVPKSEIFSELNKALVESLFDDVHEGGGVGSTMGWSTRQANANESLGVERLVDGCFGRGLSWNY
jgi:hypothetical protein